MPSAIFICGHLGASLISSSRERAFLVSGARVPSVEGTRSEGVAGFLQRDQGDEGEGSALVPEAEAASGDRYIKKHIETSSIHPLYHVCFGGMIFAPRNAATASTSSGTLPAVITDRGRRLLPIHLVLSCLHFSTRKWIEDWVLDES
ncbi:hypothetical protein MUK42_34579 [Musa troglodytarum]|uniref:Uncharacterized protein n=1 Tax=Musa troglodytarum TaxID=320322 RepID=A0A9E7HAH1_9LILI|nr:hypothetical protein MUK42_34579 [Musa troglodytarum]URE29718.1 hypothetical protein MUK42_34579 [Musa troglodytarum]